jgi:hypothetical protein
MKKTKEKKEPLVQVNALEQKGEKIWFVQYGTVRRHSRVLYLPLDPVLVRLHHIKKGDVIKYQTLQLRRSPEEDAPIGADAGEL